MPGYKRKKYGLKPLRDLSLNGFNSPALSWYISAPAIQCDGLQSAVRNLRLFKDVSK